MHIDTLREELHRQPFRPFHLRLVDGRRLPVPHPDFVAVSPRRVVVINPADESMEILEPLLILSVDVPAPSPTVSPGNGQPPA